MKRTTHFTGITGRESAFDPTKNRDISRSNGQLEELPSCRLSYNMDASYDYLSHHSPCATAFDLYRTGRFEDDRKSTKKKTEEDELEAQKLILHPKYDYLSNKGSTGPGGISFTKAKRKNIASPADLLPQDYSSEPRGQKQPADEPPPEPEVEKKDTRTVMERRFSTGFLWEFRQIYAEKEEEEVSTAPDPALLEAERKRQKTLAKQAEREAMWREMHSHLKGSYAMDHNSSRLGFSPKSLRKNVDKDIQKRNELRPGRSATVPLRSRSPGGSGDEEEGTTTAAAAATPPPNAKTSAGTDLPMIKPKDIATYEWRKSIEAEKEKGTWKAHLFRSDVGRDKPVIGLARGYESHDYEMKIDAEEALRKQCDRPLPSIGIGSGVRFPELEEKYKADRRAEKQKARRKQVKGTKEPTGTTASPASSSKSPTSTNGGKSSSERASQKMQTGPRPRSTLFDNLPQEAPTGEGEADETQGGDTSVMTTKSEAESRRRNRTTTTAPIEGPAADDPTQLGTFGSAIAARQRAKTNVSKAHAAVGKTNFQLEDFLHSKQFKKKLRNYEEELLRSNLERMKLIPKREEQEDDRAEGNSPRAGGEQRQRKPPVGVSPPLPGMKPKPVRRTVEEEVEKEEKLRHLHALSGLSVDHDDFKVQWKGVAPWSKHTPVNIGANAARSLETNALASWTTPDIKGLLKSEKKKKLLQKRFDAEYAAAMLEFEDSAFMASKQHEAAMNMQRLMETEQVSEVHFGRAKKEKRELHEQQQQQLDQLRTEASSPTPAGTSTTSTTQRKISEGKKKTIAASIESKERRPKIATFSDFLPPGEK